MEKSRFKVNFGGSIHERILNWFSGNSKVWLFKWDEKTAHCYAKKKSEDIYRLSKCKILKDLIRSQQQNGSKRWQESEDLQNTNLSVCESKKGEKFMG
jgi:hypothetical protein